MTATVAECQERPLFRSVFDVPPIVDFHLRNWRDWMHRDSLRIGYPSKSAGLESGYISGDDAFDDLCLKADEHAARVVDALIDGMPQDESCAIHHAYLHACYRLRDFDASFESACQKLLRGMVAKGLI